MKKIAVFVEGWGELIFTRELLLKCFEWQDICVECYSLFNDKNLNPVQYSFPNQNASVYYQIINIGTDTKVLSSILKRESYLFSTNQNFDKIIGLRDMFSKDYKTIVQSNKIDPKINQKFIDGSIRSILANAKNPKKISFHFAIMELEAWFLGMKGFFTKLHPDLTNAKIKAALNVDLEEIDPETAIFHPAPLIKKILQLVGKDYTKKQIEVNAFMGKIIKADFKALFESEKCATFTEYCKALGIDTLLQKG
ncbi:MAG: hypothetical protein ACPGXL_00325 [Chitinophagales bacterium]